MKKLVIIVFAIVSYFGAWSQDIVAGEKMFNSNCKACHSIGKGKIVGPDLKNVLERRKESWLMGFIRTPGAVIKSGDPYAQKLFEEHNKILMPDHTFLSDNDIKNMLSYIEDQSKTEIVEVKKEDTPPVQKVSDTKDQEIQEASVPYTPFEWVLLILIGICVILALMTIYLILLVTKLYKVREEAAVK